MKTYKVRMTIHDAFHFRADTLDDARKELRDIHPLELLDDAPYEVTYTMEEEVSPKKRLRSVFV